MAITMASRNAVYGFLENKAPSIKCGNSSIAGTKIGADTWQYILTPDVIWSEIIANRANDSTATFTKELTITNDFGENFS
jgi:hypothetical protein